VAGTAVPHVVAGNCEGLAYDSPFARRLLPKMTAHPLRRYKEFVSPTIEFLAMRQDITGIGAEAAYRCRRPRV